MMTPTAVTNAQLLDKSAPECTSQFLDPYTRKSKLNAIFSSFSFRLTPDSLKATEQIWSWARLFLTHARYVNGNWQLGGGIELSPDNSMGGGSRSRTHAQYVLHVHGALCRPAGSGLVHYNYHYGKQLPTIIVLSVNGNPVSLHNEGLIHAINELIQAGDCSWTLN